MALIYIVPVPFLGTTHIVHGTSVNEDIFSKNIIGAKFFWISDRFRFEACFRIYNLVEHLMMGYCQRLDRWSFGKCSIETKIKIIWRNWITLQLSAIDLEFSITAPFSHFLNGHDRYLELPLSIPDEMAECNPISLSYSHDSYHYMTHTITWLIPSQDWSTGCWPWTWRTRMNTDHQTMKVSLMVFLVVLAFEPVLNFNLCYLKISPNKGFKKLKVAKRIRFISDIMSDRKQVR